MQHLEDLLRSKPSWHVSASGKVTHVDPGYWQRATLSVKTDADGVDRLAVRYTPYVHDPDYSQYNGRFFLRTVDIIECEERLGGSNNVLSNYDPIAEFEREEGLRPRSPAPISVPKKKRRKARQHPTITPPPAASQIAPDNKASPDSVKAEVVERPSAGQSPQESKAEGWQIRRVKEVFREILFRPDGRPPADKTVKAVQKDINEIFDAWGWKLASRDTVARAMGRRRV